MPSVPRGFSGSAGGKFGFKVLNAPQVNSAIARYGKKTSIKVFSAFKKGLLMFEAEAIRLVAGNVYWKNPIDNRRMINSITNHPVHFSFTRIEGKFGTNVEYAIYVHEGTILMEKRPFLIDALNNKKKEVIAMIIEAYKTEIYQWILLNQNLIF